ncbi:MAG: retron system putative HNH endonuclease [Campylobacterota bacterium]|nr:retron system putative HNH endonuclease [Campylobacterota bacterium]
MIKIDKDLTEIPSILKKESREKAFLHNISVGKYDDSSNLYKVGSVDKKLCELYNNKCGYCEKDISDEDKHIEHYRPKDIYYWLAYSWDNLLLSCGKCNKKKGEDFEIARTKVEYNNEPFSDIHILGKEYDEKESPKLINPEREDVLDKLSFNNESFIYSYDERISYTINQVCDLNRRTLKQHRVKILNSFLNRIYSNYEEFKKEKTLTGIVSEVKNFISETRKENEYYAFRYFIVNNINIFVREKKLQRILNPVIEELNKN